MEHLTLITPSVEYEADYRAFLQETDAIQGMFRHRLADNFSEFVSQLQHEARGEGLAEDQIPLSTFWLVRDGARIVGISRLRHELTPAGHIGFHVRPSEWRKGYGTQLLALTLQQARAIGLPRVQLVCRAENIGSKRVIEKNGGILADEYTSANNGKLYLRYWIEL